MIARAPTPLPSLGLYIGAYAITNAGAFAVVAAAKIGPKLADWRGMSRRSPALSLALLVCLLGLVGTPPTGVFLGKLTVFTAVAQGGYGWLVVVAAVNTVASLFYYLRWLAPIFRAPEGRRTAVSFGWSTGLAVTVASLSIAVGLGAGVVLAAVTGSP